MFVVQRGRLGGECCMFVVQKGYLGDECRMFVLQKGYLGPSDELNAVCLQGECCVRHTLCVCPEDLVTCFLNVHRLCAGSTIT